MNRLLLVLASLGLMIILSLITSAAVGAQELDQIVQVTKPNGETMDLPLPDMAAKKLLYGTDRANHTLPITVTEVTP